MPDASSSPSPLALASLVRLRVSVNDAAHTLAVHPDETAAEALRETLGLTGTKVSCGQGVCGACTVTLDGTPVASCLLPATALEGRAVRTVEGLSPELHPVQRAFLAEDALQCGFCTPGFVVQAAAFYDRWRKEHAPPEAPDDDAIAADLAGHLCRCGAYPGIVAAVRRACAGEFDAPVPNAAATAPRHDALEKVTGRAKYTVDTKLPGQLEGRVLRSPHAHARVTQLDLTAARAMPGVRAAVELLGASRAVRYAGQEIAAVAAVDARTAQAALAAIVVAYEVRPAVIGMDAARAPDAPRVYGSLCAKINAPNTNEAPKVPALWHGNVRGPFRLFAWCSGSARRAIARARAGSGTVASGTFRTAHQVHAAFEPHACVARWSRGGGDAGGEQLELHVSSQAVSRTARDAATRWELPPGSVRVLSSYVGGGFGAKAEIGPEVVAAVELARAAEAPVRVALDRREELSVGGNRPAEQIEFTAAATPDGALAAFASRGYGDAGVAVGNVTTAFMRLMYPGAPRDLEDWDVVTHAAPGKPMRGPGGPPAFFAMEQGVDEVARLRGEDPVALRKRWDPHPARQRLYQWIESLPVWAARRNGGGGDTGRFRRGVGMASSGWFYFCQPASELRLAVTPEGALQAACATQDMGNGTRTAIANAVAGVFGLLPSDIVVAIGDSRFPGGPMSAGSRTTASVVPPSLDASRQLLELLLARAARRFRLQNARAVPGGIAHDAGFLPWAEVFRAFPGLSTTGHRAPDRGGFLLPFPIEDMVPGREFTGGVQVSEVEVDTRLGRARVLGVWAGYASGRLIAPVLAHSQARGGIIQGIGYALYEERRLDPRAGFVLTGSLDDYHLPGVGDVPEIHLHFLEDGFDEVPGRSVGLGELVTLAPAASIANAIVHATGFRPRELPIRPDRLLAGLAGVAT